MARRPDPDARRKLVDAARAAFAEHGVDAARVEDVARAAGLSKGAFYLHFESKEALFEELVSGLFAVFQDLQIQRHEACTELVARVGAMTAEDWQQPTARRLAWAQVDHEQSVRTLEAMWRHRDVMRIILYHSPATLDRLLELLRGLLVDQLADAVRQGGLRADLDGDVVSDLLLGAWLQLGRRMIRSPRKPDLAAWARTTDALLLEGLRDRDLPVSDRSVNKDSA